MIKPPRLLLTLFLIATGLTANSLAQTIDLQKLIDDAIAAGSTRVVIPAGVHRVAPSGKHPSFHLYFKNIRNLQIDAAGATLLLTDAQKNGLTFDDVDGLALRGLTIDYDPLPFTQGTVTAIHTDEIGYDVTLDAGYPADPAEFKTRATAYIYEPTGRRLKAGAFDHYIKQITPTAPGVWRLAIRNESAVPRSQTKVGDRIVISQRSATALRFVRSRGVDVEGVTIHSAPGMAIHEAHGDGGNRYQFTVTYGPTPDGATQPRLHSTNADGIHSSYMHRGPIIENSRIEGQGDDAIAIHNNYNLIISDGRSDAVLLNSKYELALEVGDTLRVLDQRTFGLKATAQVTAIEKTAAPVGDEAQAVAALWQLYKSDVAGKSFYRVTLDHPISVTHGDLASSFDRTGAHFVVRNNVIGPHRGRGMLIKAPFGLVENNTIDGSNFCGILLGPELTTWLGGDYAPGGTIQNNTISNTGFSGNVTQTPTSILAGAIAIQARTPDNTLAPNTENAGITLESNTIQNVAAAGIVITSARDATVKNNTLSNLWADADSLAGAAYGIPRGEAIFIGEAQNITIDPPQDAIGSPVP